MDAHGIIVGKSGEYVEVYQEFNVTGLPSILLYTYGPKRILPAVAIDAQTTGALVSRGSKFFLKQLRQFLPTTVQRVTNMGYTQPAARSG